MASSCFLGSPLAAKIPYSREADGEPLNQDIKFSSSSTNASPQRSPAFGGLANLAKMFLEMAEPKKVKIERYEGDINKESPEENPIYNSAKSSFFHQQFKKSIGLDEGYGKTKL